MSQFHNGETMNTNNSCRDASIIPGHKRLSFLIISSGFSFSPQGHLNILSCRVDKINIVPRFLLNDIVRNISSEAIPFKLAFIYI